MGRLILVGSVMGVLGFVWLKPNQTTRGQTLSRHPKKRGETHSGLSSSFASLRLRKTRSASVRKN